MNRRSPFGERNDQMLRILASTGLRVGELVGLTVSDVWRVGQLRSVLFVRVTATWIISRTHPRQIGKRDEMR